jgi:tetratricopeptide (TPR) repeat protein
LYFRSAEFILVKNMTESTTFIARLKSTLPEPAWSRVTFALMHDPVVWETLQDDEFSGQALDQIGADPHGWNPAALAFLQLGTPLPVDPLAMDAKLRRNAIQEYESLLRNSPGQVAEPMSLRRAGLLAIALLEHRRMSKSWNDLPSDLKPAAVSTWFTPLACLYGLAPDPQDMLRMLIHPRSSYPFRELGLHALLSNPLSTYEQEKILKQLAADLPLPETASFLNQLGAHRSALATDLARQILDRQATFAHRKRYRYHPEQVSYLSYLLAHADLNNLAGKTDQAALLHSLAVDATQELHQQLSAQTVGKKVNSGDLDGAKLAWRAKSGGANRSLNPSEVGGATLELAFALINSGKPGEVVELFSGKHVDQSEAANPIQKLAFAQVAASEGDLSGARRSMRNAFAEMIEIFERKDGISGTKSSPINGEVNQEAQLQMLLCMGRTFLSLDLPAQAMQAAELAADIKPNDPQVISLLARTRRAAGDIQKAVAAAHLAVALQPSSPDYRRELAECLEADGDWENALIERKALVDERFSGKNQDRKPTVEDLRALAKSAIRTGQVEFGRQVCQQILEGYLEDGLSHTLIGESLLQQGDRDQALDHFRQGTLLSSHQPGTWLALARVERDAGLEDRAIDTLRAATQAVPDEPTVHLALAEAYLAKNALTQALTSLQHAYGLVTRPHLVSKTIEGKGDQSTRVAKPFVGECNPCKIASRLGETLRLLGHLPEARRVLEEAYQDQPNYPGLSYAYAKTLLAIGDLESAILPLRQIVQTDPQEIEPYLDYAEALLAQRKEPEEAVRILNKANEISPRQPKLLGLMAEALAANGEYDVALETYYQTLMTELSKDPAWSSRLSFGLGKTALKLSQPETAIASLQEAIRTDPENPQIHRTLAEAYNTLHLPEESLQSARVALQMAGNNLEMLTWFAQTAMDLQAVEEAIPALTQAIQFNPQDTSLKVKLGGAQAVLGNVPAASQTLLEILDEPTPSVNDLEDAARCLLGLNDAAAAVRFLEKANELQQGKDSQLLVDLANAYQQAGNPEQAREILDRAIALKPEDASLYLAKADLLAGMDCREEVKNSLEYAVQLHPNNPQLHHRLAIILRAMGKIDEALSHAVKMVSANNLARRSPEAKIARHLAADLARAVIKPGYARSFLPVPASQAELDGGDLEGDVGEKDSGEGNQPSREAARLETKTYLADLDASLPYYCLATELALEDGEEIAAAAALTNAMEFKGDHPRISALQTRLIYRRGDSKTAIDQFENLLERLGKDEALSTLLAGSKQDGSVGEADQLSTSARVPSLTHQALCARQDQLDILVSVGTAALEMGLWDVAKYFLCSALKSAPGEPFIHLQLARVLTLRAEYQQLCQSVGAKTHSPGAAALSTDTYRSFQKAIQAASRGSTSDPEGVHENPTSQVHFWRKRGEAAFQLSETEIKAKNYGRLSDDEQPFTGLDDSTPSDLSPEEDKGILGPDLYLAQKALIKSKDSHSGLGEAIAAVKRAIAIHPNQPLYQALLAHLAQQDDDQEEALQSILKALSTWPEETRWHSLAAELLIRSGELPAAIDHYCKATELEPGHLDHHLSLGEAYLLYGDIPQAIQAFEQARRIAPNELGPNVSLARAYLYNGDLAQAKTYAGQAVDIAPDRTEPLLLSAEIFLRSGESKTAFNRVQTALRLEPDEPDGLCLLARTLNKMNRAGEALDALDRAIPLARDPLPILIERAHLIESSRGAAEALKALQEIAADYPDEPAVLAGLARNLAAEGESEGAILVAQRALQASEHPLEVLERVRLQSLLGSLLRQAGQLDQAIHQLAEAIRMVPGDIEPYLELAMAYLERRQHSQAMDTYNKALELAPNDPRGYYQMSLALKDSRDYEGAEAMLRQAAQLAPEDVSIHRQLAALVALNLVHNRGAVPIES